MPLRLFALVLGLGAAFAVQAQLNSPYSNYGMGDLQPAEYGAARGMGYLSAGLIDKEIINIGNPASFAWINRATLDLGIGGTILTLQDANSDGINRSGNGTISHFALGLPLWKNKMGLVLGLTPYSRVSYALRQEVVRDTLIGTERLDYEGNGTLYRAHAGVGGRWKNFGVGVNASFLFGSLNYARFVTFVDTLSEGAYSTQAVVSDRVQDFILDGGLAYRFELPNDLFLNLGASGRLETSIRATEDLSYTTLIIGDVGVAIKDSVSSSDNGALVAELPAEFAVGFTLRQGLRQVDDPMWRIGGEYRQSGWAGLNDFRGNNAYANAWSLRVGGSFTPGDNPEKRGRPMDFRFGFRYGQGYLTFDNEPLTEFGMTFGVGLPVSSGFAPQRSSKIHLSLEYGQRSNDLFFSESFFRGTLGFTLSDSFWFLKSKIN